MLVHVQLDGAERTVGPTEFEDLVRDGRVGPETPVRSDALTGGRWVAAASLASWHGLRDAPGALLRRASTAPAVPWMTALAVGVTVRVHLWVTYGPAGGPGVVDRMAKWTPAILEHGEGWRLLSYGLFHAGIEHLASNMVVIAYLGVALEGLLGAANLGVVYLASVFAGAALSAIFSDNPSIGASGGDFGLLAAAVVVGWRFGDIVPRRARSRFGWVMLLWLGYLLGNGILSGEGVDNFAHVGGAVGGAVAAALLKPDLVPAWRRHNRVARLGMLAAIAVGVSAAGRLPIPTAPLVDDGLTTVRPAYWKTTWTGAGDEGYGSPLGDAVVAASTTHADGPLDADAEAAALLDHYRATDPAMTVLRDEPAALDVAHGRRLALRTKTDGGSVRDVDALVLVRGSYRHVVLLERDPRSRVAGLVDEVVDGARLTPLEAELEAKDLGDSPRGTAARARILAHAGRLDEALALLDQAGRAAPSDAVVTQTALEVATDFRRPDAVSLAEGALAAFPEDRRVLEAAVRALVAAGAPDRARTVLDAARAASPGDRRLEKLARELFPA